MLFVRVNGLPGNGLLYTIIPNELDANAAAAMFVRARYGHERIVELLEARDEDSAAFRSLVGPASLETLPERLLAFFNTGEHGAIWGELLRSKLAASDEIETVAPLLRRFLDHQLARVRAASGPKCSARS